MTESGAKRQRPGRGFPTTSWTLLLRVRGSGSDSDAALGELFTRYHEPVQAFLSKALHIPSDEAEDVAHDFFADKVLSGRLMKHYERAKGSFRPYLKEALRNFVNSWKRRNAAKRRRPEAGMVHPDELMEGWDSVGAASADAPEAAFHVAWVRGILDEALGMVRAKCEEENLMQHFAVFQGRYLCDDDPPKWSELAAPFGWDEKQARNRADVVAGHFRTVLINLVASEVGSEQMARQEIEALLALL